MLKAKIAELKEKVEEQNDLIECLNSQSLQEKDMIKQLGREIRSKDNELRERKCMIQSLTKDIS